MTTTLDFTLSPEAVVRLHDALVCLAKFNENVGLEASRDKLTLNALNSSKTSSASFTLNGTIFFQSYRFISGLRLPNGAEAPWTCSILNKALLSVFKERVIVNSEGESSIERCEVSVQERPEKTQCRFGIKIFCRHGVKKTYKLTYESVQIPRPVFDPRTCRNKWKIAAYVLKAFSEFFGPRAENLDMFYDEGKAIFTCYTEKIVFKDEVLKQPLHTAIAIDTADFEEFDVEDKIHTGISVKDFKAIVLHADTLKTSISALYSHPTRPMQLSYAENGMHSEFTLQTLGECRGVSTTSAPAPPVVRQQTSRPPTRHSVQGLILREPHENTAESMPPPPQPITRSFPRLASQRTTRPSPPPPRASINEESLFVPDDEEEERIWGDKSYEEEDEGELRWESARSVATSFSRLQSNTTSIRQDIPQNDEGRIAPTQRISQIKGLFDE